LVYLSLITMKLKYKIVKTTELSTETIIKKVIALIDEQKYGIVDVTSSSVSFDDNRRLFVGNWEYASRLNSGKFEVVNIENTRAVVFEYLPIPIFDFIWVGIIVVGINIFVSVNGSYIGGLITLPFIGLLIFKHYNLQTKANEMLATVVA